VTKWQPQRSERNGSGSPADGGYRRMKRGGLLALFLVCVLAPDVLSAQSTSDADNPILLLERARDWLTLGRERFDRAALEEAIDYARRALEGNPRYTAAHLVSAEAHMWLELYDRAAGHLEAAERYGGESIERALLAARLAVLRGEFDEANSEYAEILRRQPYNEDARVGQALLDIVGGAPELAARDLQQLQQRFPENRQLLLALIRLSIDRGDEEALTQYLQFALRYHGDSAIVQLTAARAALEAEDLSSAAFHGRNAVTIAPNLEDGWLLLAETARRSGETGEAVAHYESLLRIDPENHRAWYARGVLAARNGDRTTAVQSWERAQAIRPDFELPLLAQEHHAIATLPLESEERASLAAPYREIGAQLEARFLFRQAEQAYRRGLQIYPYNTTLRRDLAELYRYRDMDGRYLRELEIIDQLGGADREVRELIETFAAVRRDSVAQEWGVDQFTADRPRTRVTVVYREAPESIVPGVSRELAWYLRSLLLSSQNIEAGEPVAAASPGRVAVVSRGRADDAELTLGVEFRLLDRRIVARYELFAGNGVIPITAGTVARSGNHRVRNALRELASRIEQRVPSRGYVLQRDFERLLIGLGTADLVEPDHIVEIYSRSDGALLGEAPVVATDDLVSVVRWDPDGPDNVGQGDLVWHVGEPDDAEDENADAETADPTAETADEGSGFAGLVQELFRIR
jgi:tetratricopeptide (TPR) repeat protein